MFIYKKKKIDVIKTKHFEEPQVVLVPKRDHPISNRFFNYVNKVGFRSVCMIYVFAFTIYDKIVTKNAIRNKRKESVILIIQSAKQFIILSTKQYKSHFVSLVLESASSS